MVSSTGSRIKKMANIMLWIGIAGSFFGGLFLIALAQESFLGTEYLAGAGLVLFLSGSFSSWVTSLLVEGYGDIVDSIKKISEK